MNGVAGFIVGNLMLVAIVCAGAGTFFVLYSAVLWLDVSEIPRGILSAVCLAGAVSASAGIGWSIDRYILNPPYRRK